MTEAKAFVPVKLICGMISSQDIFFENAENLLTDLYGPVDFFSAFIPFTFTDYYEKEMGKNLKRKFLSFQELIPPENLSEIKIRTNEIEEELKQEYKTSQRIVNLDPGFITASSLFMATAKDFAHRVPLQHGIYAHLEFLFGKKMIRTLDWTYPDYKTEEYQSFFLGVRKIYREQLKA
ncbi:MAG: DUF4416 family protein [Candidatus Aminicenantes bacterium]|nr:DUF4416 family protein [Candidatus Aminicenantes bacterium]